MPRFILAPRFALLLILTVALVGGYFIAPDYGESWDEADIYRYGNYALDAYQFIFHPQDLPAFDTNLNFYGPAYFMLVALFATPVVAWHFVYFITFLVGVYTLYLFSKRWMSEWAAFGVALIFLSQPLLWGHAFINPKDTPFMTFFMASVYLGFQMADAPRASLRRAILILGAGMILGLTVSLRVLAPLAGVFVLIYAAIKHKQQAAFIVIPNLLIAGVVAYLTWPFLWKAPIANYMESLTVMSQFPFDAKILFRGDLFSPEDLPRSYFPTLFVLQLTEPLLILFAIGLIAMAASKKIEPILLFLGWFLLPALAIIFSRSVLYDNARQLYFLLPPVFFVAGFALDFIFTRLADIKIKIALLALIVLPSIYSAIQLHPYEYAYYNSLIGGTDGAFRQFETDYWGVSFKEAIEYVNVAAPDRARILVLSGPDQIAKRYARPDLQILTEETDPTPQAGYDYVLILTRKNQSEQRCKKSETVYSVGRSGAVFTIVKKLGNTRQCNK